MIGVEQLENIEIKVDPRVILYIQGYTGQREPRPSVVELANRAAEEVLTLTQPKAIFREIPIAEIRKESIVLEGGVNLQTGERINGWWKGSRALSVAVCTIGERIEERVTEYFALGEHASAMNLDIAGTAALGWLGNQVHEHICHKAKRAGLEMGPFLNPGYREWPITDQKEIFRIIPAASIGVTLNEQCMMEPKKSLTYCAGVGVSEVLESFNRCRHCGVPKCPYRNPGKGGEVELEHLQGHM
jgi:hypothetical protein